MSTAPLTAEPGVASGPAGPKALQPGHLLGLVRKLIIFGRELVASLQQQDKAKPNQAVVRSFGTINAALIIARITRGLAIAAGLEARLVGTPPTQEKPRTDPEHRAPRPNTARPEVKRSTGQRRPATRRRKPSPAEDDAELLRGLPTAEEIAALVRSRPAGAVILDICRDLGIDSTHPLWRDVRDAIMLYGGNLIHLLTEWFARGIAVFVDRMPDGSTPPPVWGDLPCTCTGPP